MLPRDLLFGSLETLLPPRTHPKATSRDGNPPFTIEQEYPAEFISGEAHDTGQDGNSCKYSRLSTDCRQLNAIFSDKES